jgi:hypothetical protein
MTFYSNCAEEAIFTRLHCVCAPEYMANEEYAKAYNAHAANWLIPDREPTTESLSFST